MDKEILQSKTISFLRFPLAVCIVIWHINPKGTPLGYSDAVFSVESLRYLVEVGLSSHLVQIAVPAYFLISGFLFFYNMPIFSWKEYAKKLKRRVKSLLIPFVLWNIIAIVIPVLVNVLRCKNVNELTYMFFQNFPAGLWANRIRETAITNIVGQHYMEYLPACGPLWFIRDLMVMVIISPFLYYVVRELGKFWIAFLTLAFFTGVWFQFPGLQIRAWLFYSIGIYIAINGKNLVDVSKRLLYPATTLIAISFCITMWHGNLTYVGFTAHNLIVFMGVFVCIAVASRMVNQGIYIPSLLSRSCFFIYAMHTLLILSYVKLFWNMLIPGNNPLIDIVRYVAIPTTTVCLIVVTYYCSERLFPKLTSVLSGGRG